MSQAMTGLALCLHPWCSETAVVSSPYCAVCRHYAAGGDLHGRYSCACGALAWLHSGGATGWHP